jgi:integrase
VFRPLQLRGRAAAYCEQHVVAIRWFTSLLGREATLADLNRETASNFFGRLHSQGLSPLTTQNIRHRLLSLWKYAHQIGYAAEPPRIDLRRKVPSYRRHVSGQAFVRIAGKQFYLGRHDSDEARRRYLQLVANLVPSAELPLPPQAPRPERVWNLATPPVGTLLHFYRSAFRPELVERISRSQVQRYDGAVTHWHDFLQELGAVADTERHGLERFRRWLLRLGIETADRYAAAMAALLSAFGQREHRPPLSMPSEAPLAPRPLPTLPGEWTLPEFFEEWVVRGILQPRRRAAATVASYRDALRYWVQLTGNPPLQSVDDRVCLLFAERLSACSLVRRGQPWHAGAKIVDGGELLSGERPLSSIRIKNHLATIARLLRWAGPRFDPRQPAARIITDVPFVPTVAAAAAEKGAFSIEQAKAIAAACWEMQAPSALPDWIGPAQYWRLGVALFFYTGLRSGTVCRLSRRHLQKRGRATWLSVPGPIVKTRKPIELILHGRLEALLDEAGVYRQSGEFILPPACKKRNFAKLHLRLQCLAGIPADEVLSPQGWRRTHARQMALLGAQAGMEASRVALGHGDTAVTEAHYVGTSLANELRLRLPDIFE